MAIVNLTIFEGRDEETKSRLIRALTDAVVKELPAKPEHVRVVIYVGFVANVDQSPETLQGLRKIMTLVPIIGFLASAAIIAFFPFNTGQHADMIREIRQRRVENSDAQ